MFPASLASPAVRDIALPDALLTAEELPWEAHPVFPGVQMKHLVTGYDTGGALSCHLVRVAPGYALDDHDHPANTELHKVLAGGGSCRVAERDVAYSPGTMAVIPQGGVHRVDAGGDGLLLLAQFCPALK